MNYTLRFPLLSITVRGSETVRAVLPLELRQRRLQAAEPDRSTGSREFRVDTAADVSLMSVAEARALELPIPAQAIDLPLTTAAGVVTTRARIGSIVARVPGLTGELFFWPCHFYESLPATFQPLLGMAGVVNGQKRLRITIDGSPEGGNLIVELIRGA